MIERSSSKTDHCIQVLQLDHGLAITLDILGTLLDPADGQDFETHQIKACG